MNEKEKERKKLVREKMANRSIDATIVAHAFINNWHNCR